MTAKHRKNKNTWQTFTDKQDQPKICSVSGKRMYPTEREANATAAYRMSDEETGPAHLKTYKCQYCAAWHLTSKGT
jgi:hypothetical protein